MNSRTIDNLSDSELRLTKAREDRQSGHPRKALEELQELFDQLDERPEFRDLGLNIKREMGQIYLSENKAAQAAACFEYVVSRKPVDALAHYELGMVYRDLGDNSRAASNLRAAIEGGFDNLAARMNLIDAAFASRQSALALETAKRVISPALKSADLLLRVGKTLFDHLFYKEALRAFQLAQQAEPDRFEPRFRAALTSYLLSEYAATIDTLDARVTSEYDAETASLAAAAEAKLGRFDAATARLRRSIGHHPESPHAYINLALICLDQGKTQEAVAALEQFRALSGRSNAKVFYTANHNSCPELAKGVESDEAPAHPSPDKAEFYYRLASQLKEGFNYLSAVHMLLLVQANEGNSVRALYLAGVGCLNHDALSAEPVLLLRRAISLDANFHQAFNLLGRAYLRQGKMEESIAAYQQAANLHPDTFYYVDLGKALEHSSLPKAIDAYRQALSLDHSNAAAHLDLGRLFVQLEQLDKARPELEKAVELEPDFYEADYLLGRLLNRTGETEQSRKHLARFNEKKGALIQQAVIGAGYIGGGH